MNTAIKAEASTKTPREQHQCDVSVVLPSEFELESGENLAVPQLRLRILGDVDAPAIVVAGGISSGRSVADTAGEKGWWGEIVGAGRAVDPSDYCVIAFDFLPNDGETARRISTLDQARALAYALEIVRVGNIAAFIGASYGGMVALAFAAEFPARVEKFCIISAADTAHPAATAIRGIQRRIVEFGIAKGDAAGGVALARELAMITYRSAEEFETRFAPNKPAANSDLFPVCEYLAARGRAFTMKPTRYLTLSRSIDHHNVDLENIEAQTLLIGATSDNLVPLADIKRVASAIPNARFREIASVFGHDAFLKETAAITEAISSLISEKKQ